MSETTQNPILTPREVADLLKVSVRALDKWRSEAEAGPPFIRCGRLVRYRTSDLERWLDQRASAGGAS